MYRSANTSSYAREEPLAPQIHLLPRNKETDAHLRNYQAYETKLSDCREAYNVIEQSAGKRIVCFSSPNYGKTPEDYRETTGKKRTNRGDLVENTNIESEKISPLAQYEERRDARQQLPIFKERIEEMEMLQAQYLYDLQRQCIHHHYAVFQPMDTNAESRKPDPDIADALCVHCFGEISHGEIERCMNKNKPIIYVYQSIVDFRAKIWDSNVGFTGHNKLQPLF